MAPSYKISLELVLGLQMVVFLAAAIKQLSLCIHISAVQAFLQFGMYSHTPH